MTAEIRYRRVGKYINDLAMTTMRVPEAVFAFTLEEICALESWVPSEDGFHSEVVEARLALEKLHEPKSS